MEVKYEKQQKNLKKIMTYFSSHYHSPTNLHKIFLLLHLQLELVIALYRHLYLIFTLYIFFI
jgi:hypothetical protein